VNGELERIWNEAVSAYSKYYTGFLPAGAEETKENPSV
jgi:hypothetical protein